MSSDVEDMSIDPSLQCTLHIKVQNLDYSNQQCAAFKTCYSFSTMFIAKMNIIRTQFAHKVKAYKSICTLLLVY